MSYSFSTRAVMRRATCAAVIACASLATNQAAAQSATDADIAVARKLVIDGNEALDQRDFALAESRFIRADALYHAPTITLGLARARAGLGKLVAAQEAYNRVVHTTVPKDASEAFVKAINDARLELAALAPRVPSAIIQVRGSSSPRVAIDGVEVPIAALGEPRPLDPGSHTVRATAAGFAANEVTVKLGEGRTETVTLTLVPGPGGPAETMAAPQVDGASPAVRSSRAPIGFAAIGVGGAGVIVGIATGVVGLSKQRDLLKHCANGACPSNSMALYGSEVSTYQTMSTVSTVGLVVGGALVVTGIVLVVTAPKSQAPTAAVAPVLGLGSAGLRGWF